MTKPTSRKMWMFPRNIRKIEPWKMVQISQLLDVCTAQINSQIVQNQLYSQLAQLGIKVVANVNGVANSGGMRTYIAQLVCLGLFWKDDQNNLKTTFAGQELVKAKEPLKVLRCQLLRMQYPSVYGLSHNVNVCKSIKVKPFVFLIKLLKDPRLGGYLRCLDMAVAVIYGRTFDSYELCVEKILKLRKTDDLSTIVETVDDLRTPKRYRENDPETDFKLGLTDALQIANTAKNYLLATHILLEDLENSKKFILNNDPKIQADLQLWMDEEIKNIDENHQSACQLHYGRYTKIKSVPFRTVSRVDGAKSLICSNFITAAQSSPFDFDISSFVNEQASTWGKEPQEIEIYIKDIKPKLRSIELESIKRAASSSGKESIKLEKSSAAIFRRLGFDLTEHLGQKKAPRSGGYPDIRIRVSGGCECGFADTKATMNYDIPIGDQTKLQTYYKECWREFEDKSRSTFFVFIAGGYKKQVSTIQSLLRNCSIKYGCPVSAITVEALLDLVDMPRPPSTKEIVEAFRKGTYYTSGIGITSSIRYRDAELFDTLL